MQDKFGGKKTDDSNLTTKKTNEASIAKDKGKGSTSNPAEVANKNSTVKASPTSAG